MSSEITHAGLPADTLAVAPNWRREVRDTLILTLPIAAALLAEMGMGVIDYSMSGHLDPLKHPGALAAAGKATFVSILGLDRARAQARLLGDQANGHLEIFGAKADPLRWMTDFVITRKS